MRYTQARDMSEDGQEEVASQCIPFYPSKLLCSLAVAHMIYLCNGEVRSAHSIVSSSELNIMMVNSNQIIRLEHITPRLARNIEDG